MNASYALAFGLLLSLAFQKPKSLEIWRERAAVFAKKILPWCVVGLGAGLDFKVLLKAGSQGIGITLLGLGSTFAAAHILSKFLNVKSPIAELITVGTAICGGSAIAAAAPVLKAKSHDIAVATGVVFILNAVGLWVFPWLGHQMGLTEQQFGYWAALAIHDTSSVVGACAQYGTEALQLGTTVKLARTIWIFPVVLALNFRSSDGFEKGFKLKPYLPPWFIGAFVVVSLIRSLFAGGVVPFEVFEWIVQVARYGLVLVLFLIGFSMSLKKIKETGFRPFALGLTLWIFSAAFSLFITLQI